MNRKLKGTAFIWNKQFFFAVNCFDQFNEFLKPSLKTHTWTGIRNESRSTKHTAKVAYSDTPHNWPVNLHVSCILWLTSKVGMPKFFSKSRALTGKRQCQQPLQLDVEFLPFTCSPHESCCWDLLEFWAKQLPNAFVIWNTSQYVQL